jgi:hypothetical protein
MNDKEFLNKITIAYKVYSQQVGPKLDIENFIAWMYRQYGIVQDEKEQNK